MAGTTSEIRADLRKLMDTYPSTSRSTLIRRELGATIEAVYVAGHIEQAEYRNLMEEVR